MAPKGPSEARATVDFVTNGATQFQHSSWRSSFGLGPDRICRRGCHQSVRRFGGGFDRSLGCGWDAVPGSIWGWITF